ncbi:DUF2059 domain-containing protein [bacterium]|nr:DUF2059 domain-containing protein [bacterium]
MKRIIKLTAIIIILFVASTVWAEKITDKSLDKLMDLSGMNKQFSGISGMIVMGMEQARKQTPIIGDKEFENIKRVSAEAFSSEKILKILKAELKKKISEAETKNLFAWYESDLGKKITAAEVKSSTPMAYQEMMQNASVLLKDVERVKLAQKINSFISSSDMIVQLQMKTSIAVFVAISIAMEPDKKVNLKAFKKNLKAQKPQFVKQAEQMTILSLVYSYRDIDVKDIEKYIKFIKNPGTKNLNESGIRGIKKAINHSIKLMAKSLGQIFKKHHKD